MSSNSTLDVIWTLCDAAFRWSHVAGVVVWLGAAFLLHELRERSADPARAAELLRHPSAPRLHFWLRWAAALGWTSGMLLLFSHYYHGLLGPVLLDADLPFEAQEALTKESGHPNVRAWLPGFLSLLVGWGAYELLFSWSRGALVHLSAGAVGCALWLALGWSLDVHFHYSGRAAWIHLGAIGGSVLAASLWFRVWPAQQRLLEAAQAHAELNEQDLALVRTRLAHGVFLGLAVLLFMLSNHYPLLYGDNPWPWPLVAAGGLVLAALSAAALALVRPRLPS